MGKEKRLKRQRAGLAEDIVESSLVKSKSRGKQRTRQSDKDEQVKNHPSGHQISVIKMLFNAKRKF